MLGPIGGAISNFVNDIIDKNPIINKTPIGSVLGDAVGLALDIATGNVAGALKNLGELFEGVGKLTGNIAKENPINKMLMDMARNALEKGADGEDKKAAAAAGAKGGVRSLGQLLAIVGTKLSEAMQKTMDKAAEVADKISQEASNSDKGPSVKDTQKLQELMFNLQQMQQTLNRVNETVTNLSKSASDAQGAVAKNLAV
ncbi:MAG: hypothetical protein RMM17_04235 [Acidobacteriota bacterium]|nr:hypothetical protein [Blastocatellia bacterium]MDW8411870.1 hypothetical protein [Acidobacteriota bacterium]